MKGLCELEPRYVTWGLRLGSCAAPAHSCCPYYLCQHCILHTSRGRGRCQSPSVAARLAGGGKTQVLSS